MLLNYSLYINEIITEESRTNICFVILYDEFVEIFVEIYSETWILHDASQSVPG